MAKGYWDADIDLRKFHRNLRKATPQLKAELKAEGKRRAKQFENHLKRNVTKRDGDLAATIHSVDRSQTDYFENTVILGSSELPYAAALEFGHNSQGHHVPGHHFWLPLAKRYHRLFWKAGRRIRKRIFKGFKQ